MKYCLRQIEVYVCHDECFAVEHEILLEAQSIVVVDMIGLVEVFVDIEPPLVVAGVEESEPHDGPEGEADVVQLEHQRIQEVQSTESRPEGKEHLR